MARFASFGIVLRRNDEDDDDTPTPRNTFVDDELPIPHKAAARGDIALLSSVIKKDAKLLEQRSEGGLTPLAQAVQSQQLKSVKQLIQMGADIDAQDNVGRTCLSVAAYQGWHEGVVCLLHYGAKRNICDNAGRSPLHAATYHSDTNTLSILLNSLSTNEINQPDNEMMTAVHWAAFHDRPDHLMQLIQKKADVFARDIDGKLPLHWAAQNGSFQCVHRLTSLKEGLASVNDLDQSGKSPAHYAAAAGSANIIKILSHCDNIDLEIEDPDERSPLHWAAAMGHTKAAETLLKLGVNPFASDVDGTTPLEYAEQAENQECFHMMDAHLNRKGGKLSSTVPGSSTRNSAIPPDERYRYRKSCDHLEAVPSHSVGLDIDLPHIKVLPPTTTQTMSKTTKTKTTTNRTVMTSKSEREPPRMYSASTDTDNLEHPTQLTHRPSNNHNNNHQRESYNHHHHHHHHHHHRGHQQQQMNQHVHVENEQKIFSIGDHSNIFSNLIGSSFVAGAQAPILSAEDTSSFSPREVAALQQSIDDADIWAERSGQRPTPKKEKEPMELKMMTSQNTPELNRVSVRSFRSIPPSAIPSMKEDTSGHPQQSPRQNFPHDQGYKPKDFQLPPVYTGNDVTTPRLNESWRSMLKPTAPAPHKQPITAHPPPHDFMTDNNAETRILTRMLKSTLGKVNNQPPSHFHTLHGTLDKEGIKRTSGHASIAAVLQQKRARDEKAAAAAHIKHSRIPSTRVGALVNKNNQQNRTQQPSLQESNKLKATFARSPSGILLNDREKYLEEDVTKPVDPKPLLSIHIPNSGRGKAGEKTVDLPNVHHKSKGKNKNSGTGVASKSKHGLEKLSNRYGGGGGGGEEGHRPIMKTELHSGGEKVIKMPPIHKESVQKNLRRVKMDKKIQQVTFS